MMTETKELQRDAVVSREQIAANLRAWILDLRTTDAKQLRGALCGNIAGEVRYCCLGRAALVLGATVEEESYMSLNSRPLGGLLDMHNDYEQFGMTPDEVSACARMNDSQRKTFAEIADYVEREILPRYSEPRK